MKAFRYLFLVVGLVVVVGCTSKKQEAPARDVQAEAMLDGVWLDGDDESVVFMVRHDTLFYPDANALPVPYRIYGDTLYLEGKHKSKYFIEKLTQHLFVFKNQNQERVKLVKSDDKSAMQAFDSVSDASMAEINQQLLKRDTVVLAGDQRYHCYMQVNPTTYRVVKNDINEEGVGVGRAFYDNIVNVTVYEGSRRVYSHDFTKREFAKFVPTEIMGQCILSDVIYLSCSHECVVFQSQLRIPESPSSYIVNINISRNGKMQMMQP